MYTTNMRSPPHSRGRLFLALLRVLVLLLALGPAPLVLAVTKEEVLPTFQIASSVSMTDDRDILAAAHGESVSDPAREAAPLAQASTYTYTISLPGDTYVTMGDRSATLAFTLTNDADGDADIDQVSIGLPETWDVTGETAFQIETGAAGYRIANLYETGNVGTWTVTGEYAGLTDTTDLTVSLAKLYLPLVLRNYP